MYEPTASDRKRHFNNLLEMSPDEHEKEVNRLAMETEWIPKIAERHGVKVEYIRDCAMQARQLQKRWWSDYGAIWKEHLGPTKEIKRLSRQLRRLNIQLKDAQVLNRTKLVIKTRKVPAEQLENDIEGLQRLAILLESAACSVPNGIGKSRCDWRLMAVPPHALWVAKCPGWRKRVAIKRGSNNSLVRFVYDVLVVVDPSLTFSSVQNLDTGLEQFEEFGLKDRDRIYNECFEKFASHNVTFTA